MDGCPLNKLADNKKGRLKQNFCFQTTFVIGY